MKIYKALLGLSILGLFSVANANCTEEQKANMILNNLSQATIDSICNSSQVKVEDQKSINKSYDKKVSKKSDTDENDLLIGFGISGGTGSNESKNTSTGVVVERDFDLSAQDLKIGFFLSNDNRFELSYATHKFEYDNGGDDEITAINLDWQFTYPRGDFAPYWGLGFGFYTLEDSAKFFTSNEDLTGVGFHLALGGILSVTDNIELEAAYKLKSIGWQDMQYPNGTIIEFSSSMGALYIGANLKF